MAINKIDAPLATSPATFATPVVNNLAGHSINIEPIVRISGGYIKLGALFSIGGSMYACDNDTAITGSTNGAIAIMLTPSGTTASASYVASLIGVTWSGAYHGWYDISGNLYILLKSPGDNVIPGYTIQRRHTCFQTNGVYYDFCQYTVNFTGTIRVRYTINTDVSYGIAVQIKKNGTSVHEQYRSNGWHGDEYYDLFITDGDIITLTWASTGNDGQTTGYVYHPSLCHSGEGQEQLYWNDLTWWS